VNQPTKNPPAEANHMSGSQGSQGGSTQGGLSGQGNHGQQSRGSHQSGSSRSMSEGMASAFGLQGEPQEDFQTFIDDVSDAAVRYCKARPGAAALTVFFLGFFVGWKMKPW
jgi:hypothetical protein